MTLQRDARPGSLAAKGRAAELATVGSGRQANCSTTAVPVALSVHKPLRGSGGDGWPVVAKLTHFYHESEPILVTCWRSQHGTSQAISMPVSVLDYANAAGVKRFFLRADRPGRRRMWTCEISLFRRGRLQRDGERYMPLDWLDEVPWRDWAFATETLRLNDQKQQSSKQLALL